VRILWVKADKLLPVQSGGNIRSYHILRRLAARQELTFLSYYSGDRDPDYERELEKQLPGATSVYTGKRDLSGLARVLDYIVHFPSKTPYAVGRFASFRVQDRLKACCRGRRDDVAACDFLDAAVNFPMKLAIPTVLFQHNVESEIWGRHALTESNLAKRILYKVEFAKMRHYEQRTVREFHHIIAVSERDRRLMSTWVEPSRITVVPTGVYLQQYRPEVSPLAADPLVMFVGAMDWQPNIDAVEHFCRQIWPLVQAGVPAARFRIVGRNPDRRVQKLASSSVEVTGLVHSVLDHLRQAAVIVVPLRVGGGTRLKIYEAMAAGKAVVSTSIGAEGLDVHHGRDIILADNPGTFAQAVMMLLGDIELRRRYERAAAELAGQYDWSVIGDRFAEVLGTLVGALPSAAGHPPAIEV